MYTALYRKWRPETFLSMSGQEHIIKILKNQLESGHIGHAYLFCGTRGTGKTSTARIFAKGVNCLADQGKRPCGVCEHCIEIQNGTFIDVIEIDAASNNGVENVRELRESVKYPPAKGRYKVYIIDEVHMLSTGAFNALLKTLEEPPHHVIFILATTEIHKLPATILSRCLRLDFRRLSEKEIIAKISEICTHNQVEIDDSAMSLIAANTDGAMRDALSILDQCFSTVQNKITRRDVADILGTAGEEIFIQITDAVLEKSAPEALMLVERVAADGKDIRQFMRDWTYHLRNLMIAKFADKPGEIIHLSCENIGKIEEQSKICPMELINLAITELAKASAEARWSSQPRTLLELVIVRLTNLREEASSDALAARVAALEKIIAEGAVTVQKSEGVISDTKIQEEKNSEKHAEERELSKTVKTEMTETEVQKMPDQMADSETVEQKTAEIAKIVPEAAEAAKVEPEVPDMLENVNLDQLWEKIFKEGVAKKITFNMLGRGVKIVSIDTKMIVFETDNPPKMTCLQQNTDMVQNIVMGITGKRLKVECKVAGKTEKSGAAAKDLNPDLMEQLGKLIDPSKLTITD